jgi:hypothetical protein
MQKERNQFHINAREDGDLAEANIWGTQTYLYSYGACDKAFINRKFMIYIGTSLIRKTVWNLKGVLQ